jgi:hypothetical protein
LTGVMAKTPLMNGQAEARHRGSCIGPVRRRHEK